MRAFLSGLRRTGGIILPVSVVLMAFVVASGAVKLPWQTAVSENTAPPPKEALAVELVAGKPNSLLVPEEVRRSLGIHKGNADQIAVAEKPTRTRPLVMPGSTALDPARLIRVRVRFAPAEVVEIAKIDDPHSSPGNVPPLRRELQVGDAVKKGGLLAVLSSVDVGNKKNDLFDAISQLRLDEEVLKRAEARSAAVPEVFLLGARRNVQTDINAVNRAENTLKTWAIPEEDIQAVRDAVRNISSAEERRAGEKDRLEKWMFGRIRG
jgi:membrane fusion protein, heavy metal efflux system